MLPTRATVTDPRQWGYDARLGENLLRIISSSQLPLELTRESSQAPTVSTEVNPEDFTETIGRTFSQSELTGGEGRRYAHRRTEASQDATGFWYSSGLRLDESGDLEVVNTVSLHDTVAPAGTPRMVSNASYVYLLDAGGLSRFDVDGGGKTAVDPGLANDEVDLALLGSDVVVADDLEVRHDQGTGTWAQYSDLAGVERMWTPKGRLFVSTGNVLYHDPAGVGPHTDLITLPEGFTFTSVADGGAFVLATADDGNVYAFTFDGTTHTLAGQTTFFNEVPILVAALYGVVLVITASMDDDGVNVVRLWSATLREDGSLELAAQREWSGVTVLPGALSPLERDSLFFGLEDLTTGQVVLWRYNVRFSSLMSDLILDDADTVTEQVTAVTKAGGRLWSLCSSGALYRETTSKRLLGEFVGPLADFFTSDPKPWSAASVSVRISEPGDQARVFACSSEEILDEPLMSDCWTPLGTIQSASDTDRSINVLRAPSRYLAMRVQVMRGARLRGYRFSALPPVSDTEVTLFVNVSDMVARPGKRPVRVPGHGEAMWEEMRNLQNQRLDLELYDLGVLYKGALTEVSTPVTVRTNRGSVTKVMRCVFRGREYLPILTDNNVWGLHLWGEGVWGYPALDEFEYVIVPSPTPLVGLLYGGNPATAPLDTIHGGDPTTTPADTIHGGSP